MAETFRKMAVFGEHIVNGFPMFGKFQAIRVHSRELAVKFFP
jgi:hypothetical protein